MKEQWKEQFRNIGDGSVRFIATREEIEDFISRLLEEQRKEAYGEGVEKAWQQAKEEYKRTIETILSEAPKDMGKTTEVRHDMITQYVDGFNEANQQWRELIKKHL